MALIGGVLVAIGPFLPWANLGMISADGLQKTDDEALVLVGLGVLVGLVTIGALTNGKSASRAALILLGLASGGLSFFYYAQVEEQIESISIGAPSVGIGLYLCLVGSGLTLVGGLASDDSATS